MERTLSEYEEFEYVVDEWRAWFCVGGVHGMLDVMFVALDIGGTSIRVAAVRQLGRVTVVERDVRLFATQNRYAADLQTLREAIRLLAPGRVQGIGVSVAGRVDRVRGRVVHSPNISAWDGKGLAADLQKTFGCEVVVENDAVCAALGEATYGTARGDFFFVAWGTGIGGAMVTHVKKTLVVGASELGHQVIPVHEKAMVFEQYSGGIGVQRRFRKQPEVLTTREWEEVLDGMEIGMANMLMVRPAPMVVFGGGFAVYHADKVRALHRRLQRRRAAYPMLALPPFYVTSLGDFAGLYGAFARMKLGARRLLFV